MAFDYSPEEWRNFLIDQVQVRMPDCERYEDYYSGQHPLAFATSKFREAFGDLFTEFADNFMELVVDVPVDKLKVTGFDYGSNELNDKAWMLWRKFQMEARSRIAHTEAVKCRASYILVDPVLKKLTVWHPKMAYVEVDPTDPTNRYAGIVRWIDVDGRTYANVYLPDATYKYRAKQDQPHAPQIVLPGQERYPVTGGWEQVGDPIPNRLGVVNLIPLENNPTLLKGGKSDLDVVIPLQDGANKELMDMFIASEFQAFKQRVLTGVEVPKYPEDYPDPTKAGKPMESAELMAAISRTWFIEDPNAKVTELGGLDLTSYTNVVDMLVGHIATHSRIPPQHFLSPTRATLANVNAESMSIINDGFVSKVERKQDDFGPPWVEAMRLLLQLQGSKVPDDVVGEVKWAPVTKPAISAIADALVKLDGLGVPREWAWQQIGATPEEAADWRKQLITRQAQMAKQMQESSGLVGPDGTPLAPSRPQGDQNPSAAPSGPQTTPQAPQKG